MHYFLVLGSRGAGLWLVRGFGTALMHGSVTAVMAILAKLGYAVAASTGRPEQAANVACLPGIVGKSLAMPDIHWGYGFPIGGVAAFDADAGGGAGHPHPPVIDGMPTHHTRLLIARTRSPTTGSCS